MPRQFVSQLQPRQEIDEIYRVLDKQLRSNRQGNLYLLVQLSDRTGVISGMRWNADQQMYEDFQKGEFVRVEGLTQLYNGGMQLIINEIDPVPESQVNQDDFAAIDAQRSKQLRIDIEQLLRSVREPSLQALAEAFIADQSLMQKFSLAPAGVKTHHAHPGGLLQHVVDLMKLVDIVAPRYPHIDRDLLMFGTFLHDIGKVEELAFENELSYTDPGQLMGHLVQGVQILQIKVDAVRSRGTTLTDQTLWRLQHMIVSHHGSLEHGSPRVPMTLEAIMLHYLDDMDAKLNSASELIRSDMNSDSAWTNYNPTLGRKMYKPSHTKLGK